MPNHHDSNQLKKLGAVTARIASPPRLCSGSRLRGRGRVDVRCGWTDSRGDEANLRVPVSTQYVPVAQATNEITVGFFDPIIAHYNRRPTVTVQPNPVLGGT